MYAIFEIDKKVWRDVHKWMNYVKACKEAKVQPDYGTFWNNLKSGYTSEKFGLIHKLAILYKKRELMK